MIKRIKSVGDLKLYEKELIKIYKQCFFEPPWNEMFEDDEVKSWFYEMINFPKNICLVIFHQDRLVGATFTFPAQYKDDVKSYLPVNINLKEVIYLAEIFISQDFRRRSLGERLHNERLSLAAKEEFKWALQRTNFNSKMFPLLIKTEFKVIGEQDVLSKKVINGKILEISDKRAISLKKLR